MRTSTYADYLTHVSALIGVDQADFQSTELTFLNVFFNKAIRKIWESNSWTDISPKGEVRFPNNLLTYYNDITQGTWTTSGITAVPNTLANPLDSNVTATQIVESPITSNHGYSNSFNILPNNTYRVSGFIRPNQRNFAVVTVSDGAASWVAQFDTLNCVAMSLTGTNSVAAIGRTANGFLFWQLAFVSSSSATQGAFTVDLSTDGSTTYYIGIATSGAYVWGHTAFNLSINSPSSYYIPWQQAGESGIDAMFEVWGSDPGGYLNPYRLAYNTTTQGVELLGPMRCAPVYTWYRQQRPIYTTDPAQTFPYIFFEYCVHSAYADWLEVEGQTMKAQAIRGYATSFIDDENDRQERQMGEIMPWKVYTHLTSQNRALGFGLGTISDNGIGSFLIDASGSFFTDNSGSIIYST